MIHDALPIGIICSQGEAFIIYERGNSSLIGVGDVVGADALIGAETSHFRFKARTMLVVYFLRQVGTL